METVKTLPGLRPRPAQALCWPLCTLDANLTFSVGLQTCPSSPRLLERPVLPPPVAIDTASYKIFVSGKSGVGKTALVAKLAGLEVPVVHHETTAGLFVHPGTAFLALPAFLGHGFPGAPEAQKHQLPRPHPGRLQ
ncbi:PREDICTED: REM2- and Rab-like small GTPase 1 [Bison bison bison]|uniref:REM2- and Rab-like small GTPase 1 n=1 Tax=Bison bison bison TaxID=43346 RepID=A0A6P3H275_BISBB|nr:PREDICTED: REM2- and Rab-like small GTPase 1 [Bison bison bison]